MELFATEIKLESQRVKEECGCMKLPKTTRYTSLQKHKRQHKCLLSMLNRITHLLQSTDGGYKHKHMHNSASMWLSDQEASHQSLCSDTNLASATLWLLFKLACTQGSTLPVNIKSWHNSLKQTQQDIRKITSEMNVRLALNLIAVIHICDIFDQMVWVVNLWKTQRRGEMKKLVKMHPNLSVQTNIVLIFVYLFRVAGRVPCILDKKNKSIKIISKQQWLPLG